MAQQGVTSDPAPALGRGLKLLEILYAQGAMSLEQIAAESGLPKSSVLRLLQSLIAGGAAARDPQTLAFRALMRLAPIDSSVRRLKQHCAASMAALGEACRNTVELHRCDASGLEMIDRQSPSDAVVLAIARVGWRREMAEFDAMTQIAAAFGGYPLDPQLWHWSKGKHHAISAQRARQMVAQTRQAGYAIDIDINPHGVRRYAAPIFNTDGQLVAVLAIAQACTPHSYEPDPSFGQAIRQTAHRLSNFAM